MLMLVCTLSFFASLIFEKKKPRLCAEESKLLSNAICNSTRIMSCLIDHVACCRPSR